MVVRIIYRPSHPGADTLPRVTRDFRVEQSATRILDEDEAPVPREAEPAPLPPRYVSAALRHLALFLFRFGLIAFAMAVWRIADDLGLPLRFIIRAGIFSHWQVWFALGVLIMCAAGLVARRVRFSRAGEGRDEGNAQAA